MNYLSVCSGIEAATVAWHELGWKPIGFSEIEKFPSQVLASHYPNVTNFGDMTKYKEWNINEPVDLLVGGTPCQSFSVAGLRKGLQDPRGNLALVYLGIADHFKPKWIVWENVPGVLSSNGGRDFGSFLGALAELGYGFAYRVLDAQHFGVPQRRKRVFVVGCLGDWRSAASVLFESESLRGDIKASKREGKEVANCLTKSPSSYSSFNPARSEGNAVIVYETHPADSRVKEMGETCQTVTLRWGTGGGNVPIATAYNITFCDANGTRKDRPNGGMYVNETETSNTLTLAGVGTNVVHNMRVRRLTQIECERLQGFPDNYTNIAKASDSARYKALGNSMAVPVMRWIGERINAS